MAWRGGGQIQVSLNHLPLNSDFSTDFEHFILEILENLKKGEIFTKLTLKIVISAGAEQARS